MIDVPSDAELVDAIEAFLDRHDMRPTRLGSEATGEPQLVSSIKGGRSPSLRVLQRLKAYMRRKDAELAGADHAGDATAAAVPPSSGNRDDVSARGVAA